MNDNDVRNKALHELFGVTCEQFIERIRKQLAHEGITDPMAAQQRAHEILGEALGFASGWPGIYQTGEWRPATPIDESTSNGE